MCAALTYSPTIVGDYSVDGDRKFYPDRRNLARITVDWEEHREKKVEYDLNTAMDKVHRKHMGAFTLTRMTQWILVNKLQLSGVHFVTARYVLRMLLRGYYEKTELVLHVTRFRGTIYLKPWISPEEVAARNNCSPQTLKMTSWGYKFEQFMADGSDPTTGNDENESYCSVVKASLGDHCLLFGSEVDGVDSQTYDEQNTPRCQDLIELKTQKKGPLDQEQELTKYKLKDCWTQCVLVGIPRVIVGFRDDVGVVRRLKTFRTHDMPAKARGFFSPKLMFNFLNEFLRWTKTQVTEDDPRVVHEIIVSGGRYCIRPHPDAAGSVLPEEYVAQIMGN